MAELDPKVRIANLVQRRDRLQANVQRIQGRRDAAATELASVEEECRKKKVDPAKIDETIATLTSKLTTETNALEAKIKAAEEKVAPFLKEEAP